MARGIHKLAARTVSTASKSGLYGDGGGLYLQITQAGVKSWLFRYMCDGKARGMGLGPLHTVSLAEARDKAHVCRSMLVKGIDPLEVKETQKKEKQDAKQVAEQLAESDSRTFKLCASEYIETKKAGWKNAKHKEQWENTLKTYAYPVIGDMPVASIEVRHVMDILKPIWTTKTETASRVRGRIEAVLSSACAHGYRTGENPARWKGLLSELLPKESTITTVRHHPALPYRDIADFIKILHGDTSISGAALYFLILTATRTSETLNATWPEFDLTSRNWTIPAERMKTRRQHRVPLTETAHAVLERMRTLSRSNYVFPGLRREKPLSNMALLQLLKRLKRCDLTVHGFRSTFRDWAAECTNHPREICELALAHDVKNETEAAYQRGDLFQKRAKLMSDWSDYCEGVIRHSP